MTAIEDKTKQQQQNGHDHEDHHDSPDPISVEISILRSQLSFVMNKISDMSWGKGKQYDRQ